MKKIIVTSLVVICFVQLAIALPNVNQKQRSQGLNKTAAGCNQTAAVIDLDVNNVRARLMTGGDMWWDRANGTAQYEVPKGNNTNALFAGSLWIGGIDRSSQELKVAGQTYRQSGNDYWTGPLDGVGSVDFQTCSDWDRFWKINKTDINVFKALYESCANDPNCISSTLSQASTSVPEVIKEWPGRLSTTAVGSGNDALAVPDKEMAPFIDINNDGRYNWRDGDYPDIDGDQYIWWVFNDKGNAKTETQSEAIGLEVHAAAFAFSTNDCLNEATFYNYRVFNVSTSPLDSCYMATWTDADLGYAFDDYIGCDTSRGLGILYNGDSYDESSTGYGFDVPMVGVDFFRGPRFFDPSIQRDTVLGMSVFTYYDNNFSRTGNPETRDDFYGYMTGTWKDNSFFLEGCEPDGTSGNPTDKVFPGDPCKGGISEPVCDRTPFDRRFVHSAGPFVLEIGAEPSDITIGAVWVPNAGSGKSACFSKIQICDDKAQKLFDSDFKLPFGPMAPEVNVTALNNKFVFQLSNLAVSNNQDEQYGRAAADADRKFFETTPKAVVNNNDDSLYKFEGYIVYQLKDGTVALSDIRSKDGSVNTDNARVAFQCDVENGVKEIFNFEADPEISDDYYIPRRMIEGTDEGIKHSFQITQDLFAQGASNELTNYKTYYYIALAYGYNNFAEFDATNFNGTQDQQYIESRLDGRELPIQVLAVMPDPAKDSLYVQTYADYGTGVQLTRLEGTGNGGRDLVMTRASEDQAIFSGNNQVYNPTYIGNFGPAEVKVVDPTSVVAGNYELWLEPRDRYTGDDTTLGAIPDSTTWKLVNLTTGETVLSERNVAAYNEQLIQQWGLSVNMEQVIRPGDDDTMGNNGYITSRVSFDDINKAWLSGIQDVDGESLSNWIRSGRDDNAAPNNLSVTLSSTLNCDVNDWQTSGAKLNFDREGRYEKIVDGTWAPYVMVGYDATGQCGIGLAYTDNAGDRQKINNLNKIHSIDIVFTADQSKWSKCPVIEMTDHRASITNAENGQPKFNIRKHAAWDKGIDANGNPVYHPTDMGYSWFPGYAINQETGERLNIMFGEESSNADDNGNDMLFNPTSRRIDLISFLLRWGGKHVIYVHQSKYDGGQELLNKFNTADQSSSKFGKNDASLRDIYRNMMWTGNVLASNSAPMASLKDGLIPTPTRVEIRVERPYDTYQPDPNQTLRNNGWPIYGFSTNDLAPANFGDGRNTYTGKEDELLDRIQPVPNPYYAYSEYESNRLDNRVRIINLPEKATVKIYTIEGNLVRTLNKNNSLVNFIDWDLKNTQNIPIASGMYLMHVEIPGVGETVLKWFGAMRPVDLTSF